MHVEDFIWDEDNVEHLATHQVKPEEVEDVIYEHSAVAETAVIGVPDEKWGEMIKALVFEFEVGHYRDRPLRLSTPRSLDVCSLDRS